MKKIAYIEIDTHAEIAQDFYDLMVDSEEFSVDFYFSEKIQSQINIKSEKVISADYMSILNQLRRKKYDLVIIGTAHRYFNVFNRICSEYKTAFIVHNINFSKISRFNLVQNIARKDVFYRLKLLWKEGLFYASKVYRYADHLLVLDDDLSSEKYYFLPLFYTKTYDKLENGVLTVVIPGGVSQKRRDYDRVLKNIQTLRSDEKAKFIFLGKAKDEELEKLQKLQKSLPENVSIEYFNERVSQAVFDGWMKKADVLWCPIQERTEFFSNSEIYGKTKMTGNIGDAIKYGKFAVFPADYPSKLEFIVPEEVDIMTQFKNLKESDFDFKKIFNRKKVQKDAKILLKRLVST